ncbi:MAG: hypothetical protein C0418_02505 [Coriobacteriaceae bacterium]|nr:hypothetical protein [Coriobacteriaceae bacterium]
MRLFKAGASSVALRTALAYFVGAGLWVMFTDRVLESMARDMRSLAVLDMFSDLAFVAVTGVFLYLLIRAEAGEAGESARRLEASEDRLRRTVETVSQGIVLVGRDRRAQFANAPAMRILGLSAEELASRTYDEWGLLDADGHPLSNEECAPEVVFSTGAPVLGLRRSIVRRDGTSVALELDAAPLPGGAGRPVGATVSITDISEHVEAEHRLRRLARARAFAAGAMQVFARAGTPAALLEGLCHAAGERGGFELAVVWILEEESGLLRSTYSCGAAADRLGSASVPAASDADEWPLAEVVRTGRRYVSNDARADVRLSAWRDAMQGPVGGSWAAFPLASETGPFGVLTLASGSKGFFGADVVDLFDSLAQDAAFVIARMHAEERRMRAEEELHAHKEHLEELVAERTEQLGEQRRASSELLANMSHGLRRPLNSVIGFTGVLLEGLAGDLTAEQRFQLGMVNRSGRVLLSLANDLLDIARIEGGRTQLDVAEADGTSLLEAAAELVRADAELKGTRLRVSGRPGVHMVTDASKVQQVLLHLLEEAVEGTRDGAVEASVTASGEDVVFRVIETGGPGREDVGRLFDEFRRTGRAPDDVPAASGLALAVSERLALSLGGSLTIEPVNGGGAVFTLRVPAVYDGSGAV